VITALVKPVLKLAMLCIIYILASDHSICLHPNQTVILDFLLGATRCYLQAGGERYGSYVSCWWLELE
jgi:hypothetical protein